MKGHGTKFGRKKESAIAALLAQRNLEEAAKAVGVAPNTLMKWMKDPEFDQAYRAAKRQAFGQSIARLQQASTAAVTTVLKLMVDPSAPASTRRRSGTTSATMEAPAAHSPPMPRLAITRKRASAPMLGASAQAAVPSE